MRTARALVFPLVVVSVVLFLLVETQTLSTSRALAIWILVLTAGILGALVYDVQSGDGPAHARRFEAALRKRAPAPSPPAELLRMERELDLGSGSEGAMYAHRRLLPLLRAAAAARIATRHGGDLVRRPDAARALLGDDVWELVRPDRPEPADRHGPGVPRRRIVAAIERVESL